MRLVRTLEEEALGGFEHETTRLRGSGHLNREQVFARDEYRCVYCGQVVPVEELSVDHVQPRVRGGDRSGGNLVTACRACNALKGHRHIAEFLIDVPAARRSEEHTSELQSRLHLVCRL